MVNSAIITTLSDGNKLIANANHKRELKINRCYLQSLLYVRIDSIKISLMHNKYAKMDLKLNI